MRTAKLALVLALTLVALVAMPVSAAKPEVVSGGGEEWDYIPWETPPCEFTVLDHITYTYREKSFFDNAGNMVRFEVSYEGTDRYYNPANPAVVLSGHWVEHYRLDPQTGEWSGRGLPLHITVSGYGTVMVRAGHWVGSPYGQGVGKDSFESAEDLEQFCACLAVD